jgi:MFS family permease
MGETKMARSIEAFVGETLDNARLGPVHYRVFALIAAAFAPNYTWLAVGRFIAGIGLRAEQPLCFAAAGKYAPKNIRGRYIAMVQFIGGTSVWPLTTLFALAFRDTLGWRVADHGFDGPDGASASVPSELVPALRWGTHAPLPLPGRVRLGARTLSAKGGRVRCASDAGEAGGFPARGGVGHAVHRRVRSGGRDAVCDGYEWRVIDPGVGGVI